MKFNGDRMQSILSEYLQGIKRLEELAALKEEDFLADPHKVASAKYHLVICIEAAIDLCNHLIAKNRLRVPEDYADTFRIMGENGLFSQDFVPKLTAMAGFRNRLVHRYWEVDNKKVFSILQENLPDFYRFIDELKARVPVMLTKDSE